MKFQPELLSRFKELLVGALYECVSLVFPESEDEVEEIEERVPSPDGAAEEAAPFYDPVAW